MSAEASVLPMKAILDEGAFTVPSYQRPYSWSQDQISVFLEDLSLLEEDEQHLFGMIVISPSPNSKPAQPEYDIIDGQQRITTTLLTLAVCYDKLQDLSNAEELSRNTDLKKEIDEIKGDLKNCIWLKGKKKRGRQKGRQKLLTENESDLERKVLKCFISDPSDLKNDSSFTGVSKLIEEYDACDFEKKSTSALKHKLIEDNEDARKTRHFKMVKNHKQISDYLENQILKSAETLEDKVIEIEDFSDKILSQLSCVRFNVDTEYNAFNLFETMNDRGLGISAMDLVKNLGLRHLQSQKARLDFLSSWKEIFEDTLEGSHLTFLRYSVNFRLPFIKKSEIYDTFKSKVFTSESIVKSEINLLKKYAGYFQDCWYTQKRSSSDDFYKQLALLQSTKTQQWIVIAMSLMHLKEEIKSDDHDDDIKKILELVYVLVFTQLMKDLGANQFEKLFPELALKIHSSISEKDRISAVLKEVQDTCRKKLSEISLISSEEIQNKIIEKNDVARMTCYAFVLSNNDNHGFDPSMTLTLEHIYPQKPDNGTWTSFKKESDDDKRKLTYALGNFLLLDKKLNPSAGNRDFLGKDGKRAKYQEQKVKDHFDQVNEKSKKKIKASGVFSSKNFTPKVINARTIKLADELEKLLKGYSA